VSVLLEIPSSEIRQFATDRYGMDLHSFFQLQASGVTDFWVVEQSEDGQETPFHFDLGYTLLLFSQFLTLF
jgi:hypothetical protein